MGVGDRSLDGLERVEAGEWVDLPLADLFGYAAPDLYPSAEALEGQPVVWKIQPDYWVENLVEAGAWAAGVAVAVAVVQPLRGRPQAETGSGAHFAAVVLSR